MTEKRATIYANDLENGLPLPEENSVVLIEVISMISPSHFFVHFPYGLGNGATLVRKLSTGGTAPLQPFHNLRQTMTQYYEERPFLHRDMIIYAEGEMIAIKCRKDSCWYRAKVIEADPDHERVKCFIVDFGNYDIINENNTRQLQPEFMQLPFQVVECFMGLQPVEACWSKEAFRTFKSHVDGEQLIGRVVSRNVTGTLTLEVFVKGISLIDILVKQGLARRRNILQVVTPKESNIKMVPG